MKKWMFAAMVVMVTMLAAACGDETTTVEGPIPVEVTGVLDACESTCVTNDDCDDMQVCQTRPELSKKCDYTVNKCVLGCDAKIETEDMTNEDGTFSKIGTKVPGTDTCQRFGDTTLYCDMTIRQCKEYTVEESVVEPIEPEPVVEPETEMTELMCCYDGHLTGLYGAFAWSMSTPTDPEKWTGVRDLSLDASGCFNALVDMNTVFLGFWVDMTYGPSKGKSDEDIEWVAAAMKPAECYIGSEVAQIGGFNNGWKFGLAARK